MNYMGQDCDMLTLRADSIVEMDKLVEKKAAGREIAGYLARKSVFSKKDNKKRVFAQVLIARVKQ